MIGILVLISIFLSVAVFSQSSATLQKNKKAIESEIAYNQKLLQATTKDKTVSLNQVVILNNNIKKRETLMGALEGEMRRIDVRIVKTNAKAEALKNELQNLRSTYAEMIRVAQKTESLYTKLAFIFAADDFNQAFLRLRYLQQLASFRRQQADKIVETQLLIEQQIKTLSEQKNEKIILTQEVLLEKDKLSKDREKMNAGIKQLEKKEKDIKKTIADKQKESKNLEKAIQKAIAEEIRKAEEQRKAANAAKTANSDFSLTPAEIALSNDFSSSRGKLPWPVAKGVLSSSYGTQAHPVLKNVTIQNNGIDIMSEQGAQALAVFGGTVSRIWALSGFNNIVMIRHGEYITVYGKLETVSVKAGDQISPRQVIGTLHTDAVSGTTEIHFELWKGKVIQNPSSWLAPFK